MMKELGKIDDNFKLFYDDCMSIGGLSPLYTAGLLSHGRKIDFDDINYRLYGAIVLLSIEDSIESKKKRVSQ